MGQNCVFCKIINRELPSTIVYEDSLVISFLPLRPVVNGHIILTPKEHFDDYTKLPNDIASYLTKISQQLGHKIKEKFAAKKAGYLVAGIEVEHAHIHILPLYKANDITAASCARVVDGKLVWSGSHLPEYTDKEKQEMSNSFCD